MSVVSPCPNTLPTFALISSIMLMRPPEFTAGLRRPGWCLDGAVDLNVRDHRVKVKSDLRSTMPYCAVRVSEAQPPHYLHSSLTSADDHVSHRRFARPHRIARTGRAPCRATVGRDH